MGLLKTLRDVSPATARISAQANAAKEEEQGAGNTTPVSDQSADTLTLDGEKQKYDKNQARDKDGNLVEIHDWYGPDDPEKPFNFSTTYKWVWKPYFISSIIDPEC